MTITELLQSHGAVADGGYPILYLDGFNDVLCAKCAQQSLDDDDERFRPSAWFIHYEGEAEYCSPCNEPTESAYGVPEHDRP